MRTLGGILHLSTISHSFVSCPSWTGIGHEHILCFPFGTLKVGKSVF